MRGKRDKKLKSKKNCKYCDKVIDRYTTFSYHMSDNEWKNKKYCNSSCQMKDKNPMFRKEIVKKNKGVFRDGHKVTKEMRKNMEGSWFKKGHNKGWIVRGKRTKEEIAMKKLLFPLGFESEVYFGTGNGGEKKFGCHSYVADFYSNKHNLVVELDGNSHKIKGAKERDKRKDLCLMEVHNLNVLRFDVRKDFNPNIILNEIKNFERGGIKKWLREIIKVDKRLWSS